jgi:hypothetical protein
MTTPAQSPAVRTLLLAALATPAALGLAWTGTLPGGGELQVDPSTHRATRVDGGEARPMWDGVHRLDDGSVVIIRDGAAVPTESMLNTWEGAAPAAQTPQDRPCEQLERRVCGQDNACRSSAACLRARSLLNAEREVQRRARPGTETPPETPPEGRTGGTAGSCEAALVDPQYAPCADSAAGAPSPCQALANRVCGDTGRCAASPACAPARQLLGQEADERAAARRPDGLTPSGTQCQEAMGLPFFAACP